MAKCVAKVRWGVLKQSEIRDFEVKWPMRGLALCLLTMTALCTIGNRANADLMLQFSEVGGNVRLDYQGTLDLTGLTFSTVQSLAERRIRLVAPIGGNVAPYTAIINLNAGTTREYSSPFASGPSVPFTTQTTPPASSSGGNSLHLPTISTAQNATLRFDVADFNVNTPDIWTGAGFMQWNNTTLAAMGIDASPKTWVLNNAAGNRITLGITAVPEPSSLVLLGVAVGACALVRRYRLGNRTIANLRSFQTNSPR